MGLVKDWAEKMRAALERVSTDHRALIKEIEADPDVEKVEPGVHDEVVVHVRPVEPAKFIKIDFEVTRRPRPHIERVADDFVTLVPSDDLMQSTRQISLNIASGRDLDMFAAALGTERDDGIEYVSPREEDPELRERLRRLCEERTKPILVPVPVAPVRSLDNDTFAARMRRRRNGGEDIAAPAPTPPDLAVRHETGNDPKIPTWLSPGVLTKLNVARTGSERTRLAELMTPRSHDLHQAVLTALVSWGDRVDQQELQWDPVNTWGRVKLGVDEGRNRFIVWVAFREDRLPYKFLIFKNGDTQGVIGNGSITNLITEMERA